MPLLKTSSFLDDHFCRKVSFRCAPPPPFELFFFQNCFIFMSSSTARALGSCSHSKGFGAELLSDSLVMVLWGGLGAAEGSVEGSTMTSLNLSPKLCLAFFPNSVSFGVFSHSKGLRAK